MRYYGLGPNRYICTVFDEMRALFKTHNYASLPSLIEEAQVLANRMEAAISDKNDIESATKHRDQLKKEIRQLEEKKEKLENESK